MILDTAGQERFNSLSLSYYKRADAILLVYDISSKSSFDRIKKFYVPKIKENCKKDIPILLLGNKTDKENKRQVSCEEGMALALEENYEFKESSCLKNINVVEAFESLIERWNFESHKVLGKNSETNSEYNLKKKQAIKRSRSVTTIDKSDNTIKELILRDKIDENKKNKIWKVC